MAGGGTSDMTFDRKLGNMGFVLMVRALFGGRYTDLCYGYNAFWRRVVPVLQLDCDGFEIETMMNVRALKAGLKVVEVASFEHDRIHGTSNLHPFRDGWRVLRTILSEKRSGTLVPHIEDAPRASLLDAAIGSHDERSRVYVEID
jgi:hypothetical protein